MIESPPADAGEQEEGRGERGRFRICERWRARILAGRTASQDAWSNKQLKSRGREKTVGGERKYRNATVSPNTLPKHEVQQ